MNEKVKINIPEPCRVRNSDQPIPPGNYIAESILGGQAVILEYNGNKYMVSKKNYEILKH